MINGLCGQSMLFALLLGITLLIFMLLKTKVHAFPALLITTVVVGVVGGMPLTNITQENGKTFGIINSITTGFGGILGSIGIIIGLGVMMSRIFEATGAAKRMAYTFLKLFGKGREEEALAFTGFLVSIPIFCDSGFVILAPIAKALSRATKKSVIALGTALAAGLVITHSLVPPTPGPLGVCGIFGVDVGTYILIAIALALPMAVASIFYSRVFLAKKFPCQVKENDEIAKGENQADNNSFNTNEEKLPNTFESFAPLVLPILLILINTVASALNLKTGFMGVLVFLGQPIIAVGLGLMLAIFSLGRHLDRDTVLAEMEKGMASAGIIMLVTGGGGALGQLIKDSGLGTYMAQGLAAASIPVVALPLLISTMMRFVQGSGTVAMTTAAGISAPILAAAGVNPLLGVIACCVGSLFFGYFNDSYFWVVNRTLGVREAKDQLMVWSVTSTVAWAIGVVEVIVLSFFMQ